LAPERLGEREAVVSEALGRELGAEAGEGLLVRMEKPSEIPQESLHGRREGSVRTVRFRVKKVAPGGLALEPQQARRVQALMLARRSEGGIDFSFPRGNKTSDAQVSRVSFFRFSVSFFFLLFF
jgi:hypothetical protein